MPLRDKIITYLNNYLSIHDFRDYAPQGLQVEGKENVQKIVTGVSASVQLFEQAAKAGADMVIVHHGILWNKESHVLKGGFKKRVKILLENDITLLAYHLPLDKHPELGNNAQAAKKLGLVNVEEFGQVGVKDPLEFAGCHRVTQDGCMGCGDVSLAHGIGVAGTRYGDDPIGGAVPNHSMAGADDRMELHSRIDPQLAYGDQDGIALFEHFDTRRQALAELGFDRPRIVAEDLLVTFVLPLRESDQLCSEATDKPLGPG